MQDSTPLLLLLFCFVSSSCRTTAGLHKEIHCLMLRWLLFLFYISGATDADSRPTPLEAHTLPTPLVPLVMPTFRQLALPPVKLPLFRRLGQKSSLPSSVHPMHGLQPSQPPHYGPFVTSAHHPPSSSTLNKGELASPNAGLAPPRLTDIAPTQSSPATLPPGLAQPPLSPHASNCCGPDTVLKRGTQGCHCVYPIRLDLLLSNVSSSSNWNLFLQEFASQLGLQVSQIELINFYMLGLSKLNISMDVTPLKGISFSASDAAQINSSLSLHRVRLDPVLVGDYHLLNVTWFKPSAPSQAPLGAIPPIEASTQLPSTPASFVPSKGNHSSLIIPVIGIASGILITAVISMLIICYCASRCGRKRTPPIKEPEKMRAIDAVRSAGSPSHPHPTSTRFLAYEELKEATNNFETASLLGEGGFGRVFKGTLSDGTAVAIKRLTSGGQQGDKEFLVEVEMLSRLHHRNLVKLIGYYSSRDSSQNLLCYELVPNGSLESWLHGPLGVNCPLDWDMRMKIALDAARGLAYLHEDSQPCVIHRDFKASNILLENNFHAKVADFGLAKQAPEGRANFLSTRVMGTFGYVAPEYAMTGHLLVKSDVYSYGVVLLELLTGRKPVDMSQPSGQENLVAWARPILRDKDRLEELADPRLGGKYPIEDFVRVCTIAAACVAPEANQRPTMGEVVQSLKMVQRVAEYQDSALTCNGRPNHRQSSTTLGSDGTSSIFSSGPYSGLSAFDNDNICRAAVFSEDLHEGSLTIQLFGTLLNCGSRFLLVMEDIGGSQFDGIGTTIRKKRSQSSRRPRPEAQLFSESQDLSPLSSIPVSDDLSKVSSDENAGDVNFKGKMFNLNQCMLRDPSSSRDEDAYSHKKIKKEDDETGTFHSNGYSEDFADYEQAVPHGSQITAVDGIRNENKLKKVKLKVGGVTRTIQAKSGPNGVSNVGITTKTARSADSHQAKQKLVLQDIADHTLPDKKSGLQGVPWKDFSRGRPSLGKEEMGKMAAKNGFDKPSEKLDPVRKSKRVPKRRVLDGAFDEDENDDELRYLEKIRIPKLGRHKELDEESTKKQRNLSRNSKGGNYEILDEVGKSSKDGKRSRSNQGSEDTDYEEDDEMLSDCEPGGKRKKMKDPSGSPTENKREITLTTRQRALLSSKDASSISGASQIEFPNGLPPPPPRKQKEQLTEVEQQLKKAEAAQRRRMQNEKAARESEAEAIRKIRMGESGKKKREDKKKKSQEERAQVKAANAHLIAANAIRWVMGPTGTLVTFPQEMGLPKLFDPKPSSYPPPREKCAGPSCDNPYKYRDSKTKLPLCSLECYKAIHKELPSKAAC